MAERHPLLVWPLELQGQSPGQPGGRPVRGRGTVFGTLGLWLCPSVPFGWPQDPAWSSVLGRPFPMGVHRKGQACCCERVATQRVWPGRAGQASAAARATLQARSARAAGAVGAVLLLSRSRPTAQCHACDSTCCVGHCVGSCGGCCFYSSSLGS